MSKLNERQGVPPIIETAERRGWCALVGLFIIVLLLTYVLSDYVLSNVVFINDILSYMSLVCPSIENYGKYSDFPIASQLVIIILLIVIPILAFPLRTFFNTPKILEERIKEPSFSFFKRIVLIIGVIFLILFYVPGKPNTHGTFIAKFLLTVYHNKFSFAFLASTLFLPLFMGMSMLWDHIYYFSEYNKKREGRNPGMGSANK